MKVLNSFNRARFTKSIKEDEMSGSWSTHGRDDKCIQYFGWKTWGEETTWKTMA